MATRNPAETHQLRLVDEIPSFTRGFIHPEGGDCRISEPSTVFPGKINFHPTGSLFTIFGMMIW